MNSNDDFGVAKSVADLLRDLTADRQARVLRWVSESLGIQLAPDKRDPNNNEAAERIEQQQPHPAGGTTNIKSFIEAKDPRSDNQFAAAAAYFYRFEAPPNQRKDAITPEELQEATRLAGRKRLGDPGKTLRNAKDMGYLDAVDRGRYAINSVGENLVAMTLPAQGRGVTSKPSRRQGKGKKPRK